MSEKREFKIRYRYGWLWKWVILAAVIIVIRSLQTFYTPNRRADSPPVLRNGTCEVVKVIDGATFLIRQPVAGDSKADQDRLIKVRLMTIEIPTDRGDPDLVALKARQFTESFLQARPTRIHLDRRRADRDGVGLVFLYAGSEKNKEGNGEVNELENDTQHEECLNIAIVRAGWARVRIYPGDAKWFQKRLRDAEEAARAEDLGIWKR